MIQFKMIKEGSLKLFNVQAVITFLFTKMYNGRNIYTMMLKFKRNKSINVIDPYMKEITISPYEEIKTIMFKRIENKSLPSIFFYSTYRPLGGWDFIKEN